MRVAVADTGALISLEKLTGGFLFIRKLYDRIYVPLQVLQEVSYYLSGSNFWDLRYYGKSG